jgi:hypothetical protein
MRRLLVLAMVGCSATSAEPRNEVTDDAGKRWDRAVADLADRRAALSRRFARAGDDAERADVLADASATLFATVTDDLMPPWLGTPWGLGKNSTARRPHEPDMTVGCSYFVTSILQGAGVVLDNRYRFAQAPALDIQRSLIGTTGKVHRFTSIPPADLAERIAALGDGLYLIGLDVHVGFVVVRGQNVRFVHASYTGDQQVSDEDLATARAIARSQTAGYFVSPVFVRSGSADDWLVTRWLTGDTIAFRAR